MNDEYCQCIKLMPPIPSSVREPELNLPPNTKVKKHNECVLSPKFKFVELPTLKLPVNHFIDWLSDKMRSQKICINFAYRRCKYLTEFIGEKEISNDWHPSTPIFISAQTGAGKNTFVYSKLMTSDFDVAKDKILLLSNRVALSRQSKYYAAHWVQEELHNPSYVKQLDSYTATGIDQHCHDFGPIHIYTYQQLYKNPDVSLKDYKYIVCDECHFFTSDSRFNEYTDKMLKKIVIEGKDAIRVYMSATPEVAFEPIVREEYNLLIKQEDDIYQAAYSDFEKEKGGLQAQRTLAKVGMSFNPNNGAFNYKNYNEYRQLYEACDEDMLFGGINRKCEEMTSEMKLNIFFYYMERDYDYIQQINFYADHDELIEKINTSVSSDEKWIIFVDSKNQGETLCEKLNRPEGESESNKEERAIFLSSKNKETELEAKDTFDSIVKNEKYGYKVLVTTSVLDNGINIKDSAVCNIAIDIYDRTEFLQMLGRLRVENDNYKINLFVKKRELKDLKNLARRAINNLVRRLMIDDFSVQQRKEAYEYVKSKCDIFDSNMYRLVDNPNVFCEYNRCAIYQLIEHLSNIITIIRKTESDFCFKYEESEPAVRQAKVVDYYTYGNGVESPWSRSVVDLLGSVQDKAKRIKYEEEDFSSYIVSKRYEYTLSDTFINYLYDSAIPQYLNHCIKQEIERGYFNQLTEEDKEVKKRYFDVLCKQKGSTKANKVCVECDVWKEIYSSFDKETKDKFFYIYRTINKLAKKIQCYHKLTNDNIKKPSDAQYIWLEKNVPRGKKDGCSIKEFDRSINNMATTLEEIEQHKSGQYYDKDFLISHGIFIKKDSCTEDEQSFSKKYLGGERLTEKLGQDVCIEGAPYTITSRRATGEGHPTYYLLIRHQDSAKQQSADE